MNQLEVDDQAAKGGVQQSAAGLHEVPVARIGEDAERDQVATLAAMILQKGRRFPESSEMYLMVHTDLLEFWLALGQHGASAIPVGYLHFVRVSEADEIITGRPAATFELQQVLPASSPVPHPVISWSGVLWTRRAAREADAAIQSYHQGLNRMPGATEAKADMRDYSGETHPVAGCTLVLRFGADCWDAASYAPGYEPVGRKGMISNFFSRPYGSTGIAVDSFIRNGGSWKSDFAQMLKAEASYIRNCAGTMEGA